MTMKMIRPAIIGILIFALMICGCGSAKVTDKEDEKEAAPAAAVAAQRIDDGRTVVGISMPDKLLERWNRDGIFLKNEFEKADCEVVLSYANNLIDTQIADIRAMIAEGADLLVVTAVDGAALSPVLEEASSMGIKIIA